MAPGRPLRLVAADIALGLAVLSVTWSLCLALAGGFDVQILGVRIRSNDGMRPVVYALLAFAIQALLRAGGAPRADSSTRATLRDALPLTCILLAAVIVRGWGLTFGLPVLFARPDEDAVAAIATGLATGDLNPRSFTYPPFFMLMVAASMRVFDVVHGYLAPLGIAPDVVLSANVTKFMIARLLSVTAGTLTVAIVHRIGVHLLGRRAGLAAAACLALAFLHVRDSHFGVTDVPMTFMLMVAFLWIAKLWVSARTQDLAGAAIATGLAVATKYNAALLALPAAFALLVDPAGRPFGRRVVRLALFGCVVLLGFLVVAPFSVVHHQQFLQELQGVSDHLRQGHGAYLGRGWVYHFTTTLRYGLGAPLFAAGLAGLAWLLWRRPRVGVLVVLFPAAYYAVAGSGYNVFTRHMQPMVPFLCLGAGYGLSELAAWLARTMRRPHWTAPVTVALLAFTLAPSAYAVFRFDQLIARTDSRLIARRWIEARFPPGTTIAQPGPASGRVIHFTDEDFGYVEAEVTAGKPAPDVLVVQWSPLQGSTLAAAHAGLPTTWYERKLALEVSSPDARNVYDRQDDFYLPMAGFHGIERPGPNLHVYVRRDLSVP